jgi:uncharacterized membrane protein YbaN (DUF454 family)
LLFSEGFLSSGAFLATTFGVLLLTTTFLGAVPEELTTTLFFLTCVSEEFSSDFECFMSVALVF